MSFLASALGPLCLTAHADHHDARFCAPEDGFPVEIEVAEWLYGLVRLIKPRVVLETGTNRGVSALAIGMALKENAAGRGGSHPAPGQLTTLDIQDYGAGSLFQQAGVEEHVKMVLGSSLAYGPPSPIDLLFLDSTAELVRAELEHFHPFLATGARILIHDAVFQAEKMIPTLEWLSRNPAWALDVWPYGRGVALLHSSPRHTA